MLLVLTRLRLSLMVAASALAGYALYPLRGGWIEAVSPITGVLLLAAGCSALNQLQERRSDALMLRTRLRPLASGRLCPSAGLAIALTLLSLALLLLALSENLVVFGLGLFAILWYNGIYTGLKRRTALALLPGALCGAIAPLIGWSAAGGALGDYRIVLLAGTLVLWQIPHFWSFACRHRADYLQAGLPSLFTLFNDGQIRRLGVLWSAALLVATGQLLAFAIVVHPAARMLLVLVVAVGLGSVGRCAWKGEPLPFGRLNAFMALLLLALLLDTTLLQL